MQIKIKRMSDTATIPTRGTEFSAGLDLYADNNKVVDILPHETVLLPTNIAMEIPNGYFGAVYPRSGISTKRGLRLANCVAVIDADFRNGIGVPIHNDTNHVASIQPGERVAQIIIQKFEDVNFVEVDNLSETERGLQGFGSTGV